MSPTPSNDALLNGAANEIGTWFAERLLKAKIEAEARAEAAQAEKAALMQENEHLRAVVLAALSYPYIPQGMVEKLETMMKKETKK